MRPLYCRVRPWKLAPSLFKLSSGATLLKQTSPSGFLCRFVFPLVLCPAHHLSHPPLRSSYPSAFLDCFTFLLSPLFVSVFELISNRCSGTRLLLAKNFYLVLYRVQLSSRCLTVSPLGTHSADLSGYHIGFIPSDTS